jgi:putative DNA primase/helicase
MTLNAVLRTGAEVPGPHDHRRAARSELGKILAGAGNGALDTSPLGGYGDALTHIYEAWKAGGAVGARKAYEALARLDPALAGLDESEERFYPDELPLDPELLKRLDKYPCTDAGQAEILATLYHGRMRYAPGLGWLIWTGHRWQRDGRSAIMQFALVGIRAKQQAVLVRTIPDDKEADKAWNADIRWSKRAEDARKLEAAVTLAATMPDLVTPVHDLDQHDHLLGVGNGVVDLRSGQLRAGDPRDLLTQASTISFYPDATAPRWEQFLNEVFEGDQEVVSYIQRAVGYSLTGSTREQCYFQCYGTGANGKSTLLQILLELGGEYAKETPFSTFEMNRQSGQGYDLADLRGKRIVLSSETADGARLNEARVKAVTGGDTISARHLYKEYFTFSPKFHLWFASNHKPTIKGTDLGIWRRVRLIPFAASFTGDKADRELLSKLRAELPGILAWAVQGAVEWWARGLQEPDIVKAATEEYRADSDMLGKFLTESTMLGEDKTAESALLYRCYTEWCTENGLHELNRIKFGQELKERGFEPVMLGKSRKRSYKGLGLLAEVIIGDRNRSQGDQSEMPFLREE